MAWELFGPMFGRDEDNQCHASPLADRLFSPPGLVDGAVQRVTNQLARSATDWVVSDSDAREAAQALASLPPALQGQAVSRLDPATFERLMHELPQAEREQLKPLSDHCDDPVRKLELFAVSHTSQVENDARRARSQLGGADRDNARRDAITQDTRKEVDSEVSFLLQQARQGKITAAQAQSYIAAKEQEHTAELRSLNKQIGTLAGLPDGLRAEYVRAQAEEGLSRSTLDWQVTADEARNAVAMLSDLPEHERGNVVATLDSAAFERILSQLPAHSHQLLAPLLADCTDPQRKLQLFSAYHKATIRSDARREQRQTRDEGTPGHQTDTQQENQRQNQRRDGIIATTDAEIDEEVAFLLSQSAGGSPLTLDAVNALMQRKEHEHQIEMKYNVNLTNDVQQGQRKSPFQPFTERATWSDAELSLLDAGLGRLPVEHVRNNPGLSQIRRSKLDRDWDGEKKEWVDDTGSGGFADATDHSIHITDLGAHGEPWRTPKMSDLARHRAGGSNGEQPLSLMEEVIGHEIGHNVHQQNPALFQKFESVTGWEHLGLSVLLERLMAAAPAGGGFSAAEANAEVEQLESHRQAHYPSRPSIRIAGMDYKIDPYTRDYLAVGPGAISTGRDWDYGRSNPQDHFAEYYTKAIHAPESLYRDLKEEPAAKLATARSQLAALKRRGEDVPAEQLATAEDTVMQAERDEKSRRWQWNLLREQVFHLGQGDVDAKVAAFTARLPPDKMALSGVFRQRAAMCMTPQQLQNLEAEFHAQLR